MAGHSKWANIKHRKERQDAAKGKVFTKMIRAITVAAKHGGGDVTANSNLRLAVDKALAANMSRDTIDRAIKRGAGGAEDSNIETVYYEGYGPAGVAVLVECMTDNRNRTVSDVRYAFTKSGGNLGADGSVSYLFKKHGIITFAPGSDEDKIMEIALEAGADDVITNDDKSIDVITTWENFSPVKDVIENAKLKPVNAETTMLASMKAPINDAETAEKIIRLIDTLEELDDVQNVYSNEDIATEILEKL
jgi:YebC/PmpR family DNA-binding regulatory protein